MQFLEYDYFSGQLPAITTFQTNVIGQKVDPSSETKRIKQVLNNAKDLLNDIPQTEYNTISKNFDIFRKLKMDIASKYKVQFVTNATMKMYEILGRERIFDAVVNVDKNKHLNVFCNAELPGGFIIAINHYLKTMRPDLSYNWIACSYVSDRGETLGDMYKVLEMNKSNWLMDDRNNGDLTDTDTLLIIADYVHARFPQGVQLYTSDAGIDVSADYNNQEKQTLLLNFGQVLCGLLSLAKGGCMIFKQFTFFTMFNQSLLALLTALFGEVRIVKPVTSKILNSEVYVVCKRFNGISNSLAQFLAHVHRSGVRANVPLIMYTNMLFEGYLNQMARTLFEERQADVIKMAVGVYREVGNRGSLNQVLNRITNKTKKNMQMYWLDNNPMRPILKSDVIQSA